MKRYQFNLAAALRARRAQEDVAKSHLQKANLAAVAAELAASNSLAHYEEVKSSSGEALVAQRDRAVLAARAVLEARQSLTATRAAVGEAMDNYFAAARAVSLLERLDERRRDEHALEVQREEASVSDELSAARHFRRLRRSGRS
jgi:flagellar export protein FliJ